MKMMTFRTCNGCTLDLSCGFCYRTSAQGGVTNGSCMAVGVDVFNQEPATDHSEYGRCSNYTESTPDLVWAYEYCPNPYAWMAILGLLLYVAFFAPGKSDI